MAAEYRILATQPYTYIDAANMPVQGFRVTFELSQFREVHQINVPSLSDLVVKPEVEKILADRKRLAAL